MKNVSNRMIIGYAGNADRFEDWQTNTLPLRDSQQPATGTPYGAIVGTLPSGPTTRDAVNGYFVTGQASTSFSGGSAVHTASDIPLSALGRGAVLFNGVMDNTDVFFKAMQAGIGGSK
jgi:alkaline phosphatase